MSKNVKLLDEINNGFVRKLKRTSAFNISPDLTLIEKLNDVQYNLIDLSKIVMDRSFAYILKNMYIHCKLALAEINDMIAKGTKSVTDLKLLKLRQDQKYCIFAHLYDYGHNIDLALEVMVYLKSFTETELLPIQKRLTRLIDNIVINMNESLGHISNESNISLKSPYIDHHKDQWDIIKDNVYYGSETFCSVPSPPLIGEDLLSMAEAKSDLFMQYVFVMEKCEVTFDQHHSEDFNNTRFSIPADILVIDTWECIDILKAKEYRYESYENEGPNGDLSRVLLSLENVAKTPENREAKVIRPDVDNRRNKMMYSLAELQSLSKKDSYFLNIMKYDNIAADVMLYVAMKEGYKLLKGVKYLINKGCVNGFENGDSIFEIENAKASVLLFKYYFNRFTNAMLQKRRISFKTLIVIRFVRLLTNISQCMDCSDVQSGIDEITKNYCKSITSEINEIQEPIAAVTANLQKLKNVYLHNPILNIRKLIYFVNDNS
ncbi:Hypothetical protein CINCED_3A004002 [Cinara cedri]|nr:Hypothetical protein CINCED_3A004002 [Cinara cedri]